MNHIVRPKTPVTRNVKDDPADKPFYVNEGFEHADGDKPRTRICLACETPFESEGWGNRLCPKCRRRS